MATILGSKTSRLSFLGEGIEYPFKLEWINDNIDGVTVRDSKFFKKVRKSIQMLIETKPGERVMLPTYGCRITELAFEPVPIVIVAGKKMLSEAIERWEPRVTINYIDVSEIKNKAETVVLFDINYQVIKVNTPDNFVYPFYVKTGNPV